MRTQLFKFIGILTLVILPSTLFAQPNQQRGGSNGQQPGGNGRGGFGAMFGDPEQAWAGMSQGKDPITRDDVNPVMQRMFDRMVQSMGITNGLITKQQFIEYMQQRAAGGGGGQRPSGPPSGGPPAGGQRQGGPEGGGGQPFVPQGPGGGPDGGQARGPNIDQRAEKRFRQHDINGDGLLNYDEMPEDLRGERTRWDTNGDGFIDLNEYKEYFKARMIQMQNERAGADPYDGGPDGLPDPDNPFPDEPPKPVVYRAGKLPKELPPWFQQLDTDHDGQVALYEWKNSGRSLEEFQKMDRNGDGFLTPEEVLYYVAHNPVKKDGPTQTVAADGSSPDEFTRPQGFISPTGGTQPGGRSQRFGNKPSAGGGQSPQGGQPDANSQGPGARRNPGGRQGRPGGN